MFDTAASVAALLYFLDIFLGGTLASSLGDIGIGTGGSLNTLNSNLLPRDNSVNQCGSDQWVGRICNGTQGPVAWVDVCSWGDINDPFYAEGECAGDLQCFDTINTDGEFDIHCLPNPENNVDVTDEGQFGVVYIDRHGSTSATEFNISVQMAVTMVDATITASIQGSGLKSVVQPTAAIVASIRGTPHQGCQFLWDYRHCVPSQNLDLDKNQWIDFTVGLEGEIEYYLVYAILGYIPS